MISKQEVINLLPLVADGIELSLFSEENITDTYIGWLNDKDVVKYSNQRFRDHTFGSCKHYLDTIKDSNAVFLNICSGLSSEMVGTMTVYFNHDHQTADIGIMLGNKKLWGKGIGYKAWNLLLKFLLSDVGARKVTGGALSCNLGMISIMEKSGMVSDGIRVNHESMNGRLFDIVHFAAFQGAV